jgi:hypothetical protein
MLFFLLIAILLAMLFPGFMRAIIVLGVICGIVIFIAALNEAGEMQREHQPNPPQLSQEARPPEFRRSEEATPPRLERELERLECSSPKVVIPAKETLKGMARDWGAEGTFSIEIDGLDTTQEGRHHVTCAASVTTWDASTGKILGKRDVHWRACTIEHGPRRGDVEVTFQESAPTGDCGCRTLSGADCSPSPASPPSRASPASPPSLPSLPSYELSCTSSEVLNMAQEKLAALVTRVWGFNDGEVHVRFVGIITVSPVSPPSGVTCQATAEVTVSKIDKILSSGTVHYTAQKADDGTLYVTVSQ